MATVTPLKRPVDPTGYINGSCAISKARAMAWVLERLGPSGDLENAGPDETHDWLHTVVANALRAAIDEIAIEYSKLAPTPELKEMAENALTPKDGA